MHRFRTPLLLALLAAPSFAHANDWLFVAGGETGSEYSNYGSLGVIGPTPGYSIAHGWNARIGIEGLTYRYEQNNADIDATAFGANAALGWSESTEKFWGNISAGPAWRNTDLSPDDPNSDSSGDKLSLNITAIGDYNVDESWKVSAIVSYSAFIDNAFWNRLRVMHRLSGDVFVGPEAVWQGSDEYRATKFGLAVTGIKLGERGDIGFKAGISKSKDIDAAPYAGFEYSLPF